MNLFSINNELLLLYNKRGIFPFPGEKKEDFLKKISKISLSNKKEPTSFSKLKNLFDIEPNWAQIQYTNKGLKFWEAALLEVGEEGYNLKINKIFEKKSRYLGLYQKEEVINHELCHLGRMHFDEPRYEELLAYQTSNPFRKIVGPLFESPKESLFLMIFLLCSFLADLSLSTNILLTLALKKIPLLYLGCLALRLNRRYSKFNRCKGKLKKILNNPEKALFVMYRMRDQEIDLFSKMKIEEIKEYILKQSELRWEIIKKAYFKVSI